MVVYNTEYNMAALNKFLFERQTVDGAYDN